jgi:hypothetical protein
MKSRASIEEEVFPAELEDLAVKFEALKNEITSKVLRGF